MQGSPVVSLSPSSPSFNSYSSANLAEIAARVVEEFRQESNGLDSDMFNWEQEDNNNNNNNSRDDEYQNQVNKNNHQHDDDDDDDEEEEEEEEEEFEFAVVYNKKEDTFISADDIFVNGQIKPFYPLFDTNLLLNNNDKDDVRRPRIRSPLGKLMSEERETDVSLSCSSSEADDLDNLQPGSYCVWTPKASKESTPGRCKKSNSTGTSKRWNKFRDLLYRSNSDGKDTLVFLTPTPPPPPPTHHHHHHNNNNNSNSNKKKAFKAVERSVKGGGDNKRSFLPYREDLVGFFNNVNGFTKR